MVIGLFIMGLGIAMSKLALLGTTPISTIPAVMSYATDLTIGTWTIIVNVFILALEFLILGKKFYNPTIIFQMIVAIILGVFTDIGVEIFKHIIADNNPYFVQWIWCIAACFVLSFGVSIAVTANVSVAPGDGIVMAMCLRHGSLTFPKMKVIFDSSNVIIAAILSIALMGGFYGVREGTIFAAIAVGTLVGMWKKLFGTQLGEFLSE